MKIRKYTPEDREEKEKVHQRAIREIASEDYSDKQIEAWSDFSDYGSIEENIERWIAEDGDNLIGFADYRPDEGKVTGVYVDPDCTEEGVGSKLLRKIVQDAEERGLNQLSCESSVTARKFYEKHGFEVVNEVTHETNGVEMKAYKMRIEF